MKKSLAVLAALSVSFAAGASGIVTNVAMRQIAPWSGLVEISYELTEDVPERNDFIRSMDVSVTDRTTGQVYEPKSFTRQFTYERGTKRMVWDAHADGVMFSSSNAVCSVSVCGVDLSTCLYVAIDLSAGSSASSYSMMGMEDVPVGGWSDEYKTTKLVLRRINAETPYYIGVFEITQKQWEMVMGTKPSCFIGPKSPVESVSCNAIRGSLKGSRYPANNDVDDDSFLGKLRVRTGFNFDLPTEKQWEYACRAGTTTTYSYGNNADGAYMWYSENSASVTHYVGTRLPNPWGLYDMHGNVSEWCLDAYYSSSSFRKARGGCWGSYASGCTSSYQINGYSSSEFNYVGFRLVRNLPTK